MKAAYRTNLLARDHLLERASEMPILAIEAPPGFGKSVLGRMWLDSKQVKATKVWLSLDAAARDPVILLDQLIGALGVCVNETTPPLGGETERAEYFAYIGEKLLDQAAPVFIVVDDAHWLAANTGRLYLQRLLELATVRVQMCVIMQPIALEVGLGALTAQGKVAWIHANELALGEHEVGLLAQLQGRQLSSSQVTWLFQATEGWPALTQLALAVPLEGLPPIGDSIAGAGPVREFIYERFVGGLAPMERDALWMLACLGRVPLELLEALASSAQDIPQALQRFQRLGIVQTDARARINLHPLIREVALRLLAPDTDARNPQGALLDRAAHWFWQHDERVAALHLLLNPLCSNVALARTWLIDIQFELVFHQAQLQTLIDLVELWEQRAGGGDPDLNGAVVWALILQRRFEQAEVRLRRSLELGPTADESVVVLQRAVLVGSLDDHREAGRLADRWRAQYDSSQPSIAGIAGCVSAFALKCAGRTNEAQRVLQDARRVLEVAQPGYGTGWSQLLGALISVRKGEYRSALAEVDRGLNHFPALSGFDNLRVMLQAIGAFLRYERNELTAVRDVFKEALPQLVEQGLADCLILGYTAAARERLAAGDFGTALDILAEGEAHGRSRGQTRLAISLCAERALQLTRNGLITQGRDLIGTMGENVDSDRYGPLVQDRTARLYARFALADGDAGRARQWLSPLLARARQVGSRNKLCELLLLQASTEELSGNDDKAFAALTEAFVIGRIEGYARIFLDEVALHALIQRWLECAVNAEPLVKHFVRALLSPDIDTAVRQSDSALVLSRREQQILRLLDKGFSNSHIAEHCFLSEGTVKWYLHNLYEKVNVRNRTGLLSALRERNIQF